MGISVRITVAIEKACDGCGERWAATQSFHTMGAALAFGGPAEAADWSVRIGADGAQLLCGKCEEHVRRE